MAEQERCNSVVDAIKGAVRTDPMLASKILKTFPQGSYRNRTNVRQDSDVDVCVLCENTFYYDLPQGVFAQDVGITPATYKFSEFKNDVERALVKKFGQANVQRGNKAFDVNVGATGIDADVVPCFSYRQYYHTDWASSFQYREGIALITDNTHSLITNFPIQQYNNGVAKNENTDRRFKKSVRIAKKLMHEMEEERIKSASVMVSFLIESLIWNAPNYLFDAVTLRDMTLQVIERSRYAAGRGTQLSDRMKP